MHLAQHIASTAPLAKRVLLKIPQHVPSAQKVITAPDSPLLLEAVYTQMIYHLFCLQE